MEGNIYLTAFVVVCLSRKEGVLENILSMKTIPLHTYVCS